jgi:nitrogen fixation/metabolism regulation signal transduction histidine kinase
MVSRSLQVQVLIRVVLIVLNAVLFSWLLFNTKHWYTILSAGILIVFQAYYLVRYLNRTNRILSDFLQRLREKDGTTKTLFEAQSEKNSQFYNILQEITGLIQDARIEKENQFRYLQYIVEHVGIGLIAFGESGKINLVNKAALDLFGMRELKNLRNLNMIRDDMDNFLAGLKPGQPQLMKINISGSVYQLSVKASKFRLQDERITLVSFQDIKGELDQKELESWQKLIRVLTHEIMNSITPINTLTKTMLKQNKQHEAVAREWKDGENYIEQLNDGLTMIQERGTGLIEFVEKYRDLSKLPTPTFTEIPVNELLNGLQILFREELDGSGIDFSITEAPDDLHLSADRKLVEQVLINLVRNGMDALKERKDGKIGIHAECIDNSVVIRVSDNGPGIPEELADQVFIPFFTTKENGSGIGLSLSRQIMRLHQGTIEIKSTPGMETTVSLIF